MVIVLQAFTTPTNTEVIADTSASPGTLPTPAVFTAPSILSPLIDGNNAYIWSPNVAPLQTVTFRSTFTVPGLPILSVSLPISVFYAYAANENATLTATLEIVDILGIIVISIPLFVDSNGGNSQNVAVVAADALIGIGVLVGHSARVTIDTTVTSPASILYEFDPGRYLGEITVASLINF